MKRSSMVCLQTSGLVACMSACMSLAAQSSGGSYAITRSLIAAGGTSSGSGAFRLDGSVGQSAAAATLSGADFRLSDGYWIPTSTASDTIFVDGFDP